MGAMILPKRKPGEADLGDEQEDQDLQAAALPENVAMRQSLMEVARPQAVPLEVSKANAVAMEVSTPSAVPQAVAHVVSATLKPSMVIRLWERHCH